MQTHSIWLQFGSNVALRNCEIPHIVSSYILSLGGKKTSMVSLKLENFRSVENIIVNINCRELQVLMQFKVQTANNESGQTYISVHK